MGTLGKALKRKGVLAGALLLSSIILVATLADVIAPKDPLELNVRNRLSSPSSTSLMGTDHLGRDILSRVLYGARISLIVGFCTALGASLVGILFGLLGGYTRSLGGIIMRIVDGMMAFPGTLLALTLVAVLGARFSNIIIALTVLYTPRIARIQHAAVVQVRGQEYVLAGIALGCSRVRVMLRHILPNTIGPIIVQATFILAYAVIAEAGLSFIGVGLPATTASWGNILSSGRDYLLAAPWITLFPGAAIFILVLGLNLLGDGLRDILDPRISRRR
jgi:peptide/nickel transport system permease protein